MTCVLTRFAANASFSVWGCASNSKRLVADPPFGMAAVLLWWAALVAVLANSGLARPEVDKGDLFFIAELAKTSNRQVVRLRSGKRE